MAKTSQSEHLVSLDDIKPELVDIRLIAKLPYAKYQQKWIAANKDEATLYCYNRCKAVMEQLSAQETEQGNIPLHVRQFFQVINGELSIRGKSFTALKPTLFRTVTYLAERTGVSIHYLLFGEQLPIELFGRTAGFMRTMDSLNAAQRSEILALLEQETLNTNNLFITFRDRCLEAGFAQDFNMRSISYYRWGNVLTANLLSQLFFEELPDDINDLVKTPLDQFFGNYSIILRYCVMYGLSADYLLRQDYTPYAMLEGKPLTEDQRHWLSAYLCATSKAQHKAICKMAYWLVDREDLE